MYVDNTSGTAGITLTDSGSALNTLNHNPVDGVYFLTNGAVVINNTQANQNTQYGIYVPNASGTGPITLKTITADSNVSSDGINLNTSGSVTATGVEANNNNSGYGMIIDNTSGTGPVTLTNGTFYNNGKDGFHVTSKGAISLTNFAADDNSAGYGAYLVNNTSTTSTPPGVTVQNSGSLMNSFGSSNSGVYIQTKGAVVLGNINANYDAHKSIVVDNTYGTAGVTLTNINVSASSGDVIDILTKGAVTGSNLSSQGNGSGDAIYIDNCQLSGVCTGSGNVTLTTVTTNGGSNGLYVTSNGSISVSSLTAADSDGFGADLLNSSSTVSGSISVVSANVVDNDRDGIHIESKGSVTLNGIASSGNYGAGADGVYVDNSAGTGSVSVLNTKGANTFNQNNSDGLYIYSQGTISVTSATASNNSHNGLDLTTTGTAKTITLTTVTTSHDGYDGVLTQSQGAQTFTNLQVFENGDNANYDGINVTTNGYDFILSNSYVSGNGKNGIHATVGGLTHNVRVIKSYYFGNGQYGGVDAPDIVTDGKLAFA